MPENEPDASRVTQCIVKSRLTIAGRPVGIGEVVDVDLDVPSNARRLEAGDLEVYVEPAPEGEAPESDPEPQVPLKRLRLPELRQLALNGGVDTDGLTRAQIIEALEAPPVTDPTREETP